MGKPIHISAGYPPVIAIAPENGADLLVNCLHCLLSSARVLIVRARYAGYSQGRVLMAAKGTDMEHVVHWRRMVSRREAWRSLIIVAMLGALTGGLTGCSHSLTAQSSCKDFLNASQSDQIQAIDKIAAQEDAPDATTPLGMPNISYLCTGSLNQTLGWAIAQSR